MLLQIGESLEEIIVRVLAEKEAAKASSLHEEIIRKHRPCTLQAVYKELAKLQRVGVVVKVKGGYSLRLTWIVDLINLADKMYDSYLQDPSYELLLPEEAKKRSWSFSELLKMDDFWSHIVVALFQHSKSKVMFEWIPHPWFYLVIREKMSQFQKAVSLTGKKFYMIIGGDTYLDRLCTKYWTDDLYEYSFAESPFAEQQATYLHVIDEHILTVKLTKEKAEKIEELYQTVKSAKGLQMAHVLEIITSKTKVVVTLERNAKKAEKLSRKFDNFFGISPS